MSLAIDIDKVTSVLIGGHWHKVATNSDGVSSFGLDAYEYVWGSHSDKNGFPKLIHGGGEHGIETTGFGFATPQGDVIAGPMTAIQALKVGKGKP